MAKVVLDVPKEFMGLVVGRPKTPISGRVCCLRFEPVFS